MGYHDDRVYMDIMLHCSVDHARLLAYNIQIPSGGLSGVPYIDWVLCLSGGGPL